GVVQMGVGAVTLRITPQPGVGYYTLALQWESGERHEKVFCVLPHPDSARGDGGLFGIGGSSTHDWFWDALWQMGARHCRTEFAWTSVETEKGRYNLDWVRTVAEQAQRHNMQMTVLTGHTAYHYGVRPLDAEGRVADKAYTWQPEGTIEWYNFIDAMAKTLVPRRLPTQPAEPTDTIARTGRPLVRAWEVWSEADQNFYYGSWNRYMDMLRIAYCTVKRQGRVPIVYGSCGHMTEMKYTIQSGVADYLDRIAYHPYHEDPQWMMMHWYRNMPQALAEVGMLRDTALTECGFHPPDGGATEEGFMPRVYATLKSLDEDLFVRAQCLGGVFPGRDTPNALAVQVDGELVPRPAYVAFAVTRWLLESAQYVGPLDAPEGARMELFVRQGSPMVVGWTTEGTRRVRLEISPSGRMMDALGKVTPLSGPTASVDLTPNAVAILDVSFDEFARAASAGLEMLLTTELGHECPTESRWLQSLEDDLEACVGAGAAGQLRRSVDDACDCVLRRAPHGPAAFYETQRLVGDLMLQVAAVARDRKSLEPIHTNTIWRLARMAERLGGIADGLGARWRRMHMVSNDDVQKINSQISHTRSRVLATTRGRECPFADRLLDRALDSLDEVRRGGGHARGAWWAATVNARVAHSLTAVEKPVMRRVFVTADFTSADIITKGVLLRPMPEHTLQARVYNFMPEDVTGRVSATLPVEWGEERPDGTFTAPAAGVSEPFDLEFSVPDEPRPWVRRDLGRFEWRDIKVDAPPTAQLRQLVNLSGEMSLGPLEPLIYRVFIGAYPSADEPAPDTHMSILPIRPPGRERISWGLQPAIVR
ncbi:MAG: hypothetical protein ACOCZ7_01990, partial [Armatimonadota bacterium]